MDEPPRRPAVGLAAIIVRDGKVLLGKRRGSHSAGVWSTPGGHLEWDEDFETCVAREVLEETGLEINTCEQFWFSNNVLPADDRHYVTLYFQCEVLGGEPQTLEPDKCEGWQWFDLDDLPEPLWPGMYEPFGKLASEQQHNQAESDWALLTAILAVSAGMLVITPFILWLYGYMSM